MNYLRLLKHERGLIVGHPMKVRRVNESCHTRLYGGTYGGHTGRVHGHKHVLLLAFVGGGSKNVEVMRAYGISGEEVDENFAGKLDAH